MGQGRVITLMILTSNIVTAGVGFWWALAVASPSTCSLKNCRVVPSLLVSCILVRRTTAAQPEKRHAWKHIFQRDAALSTPNPVVAHLRKTAVPLSPAPTELPLTPSPTFLESSPAPTPDPFPPVDPPSILDFTYFNYDTSLDADYGPGYPQLVFSDATSSFEQVFQNNAWATCVTPVDDYWREFDNATNGGFGPYEGTLAVHNPAENRCGNVGAQSPIDLIENSECLEHHQIRTEPGDISMNSTKKIQKLIQGNKLRLVFKEVCANCSDADIPRSDFPLDWPEFADVINVDLKVPSEHTIYGKRYDAEWQVFHLHRARQRTPVLSAMISAEEDEYNIYLQEALDAFQHVYNMDRANCARRIRKRRRLVTRIHRILGRRTNSEFHDYDTWADFSTELEQPDFTEVSATMDRKLKEAWSPLDESLIPSIYFFGYDGSLTEPPCGEWVSWRIVDTPMKIAKFQLEQIKTLIFTHVGPDCKKTSLHWMQSVARPIQDTAGRPVWRCTSSNFLSDAERRALNLTLL